MCVAEIGLYRCNKDAHYERMHKSAEHYAQEANSQEIRMRCLQYFDEHYWTPWYYNQSVAWLRVYAYPRSHKYGTSHVAADYYAIDAKRLSPDLKRKRFLWAGEAFCSAVDETLDNEGIYSLATKEIESWSKGDRVRKLTLDLDVWENIGPNLDWRELLFPPLAVDS
jgi:hypothetical protein